MQSHYFPRRLPTAAALILIAATAVSCARDPRPDLVLITVDTLRPDALGWVAGKNPTPAIDALAAEGFRFPGAVSPAPLTLPSHTSILSGLSPRRHGVRDNGQSLAGGLPLLPESLQNAGYRTGAFVSGYPLRRMFGLDRGFDTYQDELATRSDGRWQDRPAAETTALALEWLRGVKKRDPRQPFFLWLHYYDPHAPYEPPEPLRRPGPRGDYDGEVAAVDAAVATLRRGLNEAFAGRPRLLALTADHGESLGEHGEATHGFFVYDSTALVPLLFHGPGVIAPGESPAPARLVDLAPTLLALLGLPPLPETDGISLAGFFDGSASPPALPPALIESLQPFYGYGWAPLQAWRAEDAKWIEAPKPELYDLRADPGEAANLAAAAGAPAGERSDRLRRELAAELRKPPLAEADGAADPEAAAALRSLGYAGGGGGGPVRVPEGPAEIAALADPKDKARAKALLDLAESSLETGDSLEAMALFDLVLAGEPGNRYALLRSGQTLVRLGRLGEAVAQLERLLAADPGHHEARFELADALGRGGRVDDAIGHWMELLEGQPRRAVAWGNLGALLMKKGELDRAEQALAKASELDGASEVLRRNLAEALYAQALAANARGDRQKAREKLDAALQRVPELRLRAASDKRLAALLDIR